MIVSLVFIVFSRMEKNKEMVDCTGNVAAPKTMQLTSEHGFVHRLMNFNV
jgi:hypothetical protein